MSVETVVVDASVAAKWYLDEPDTAQALELLDGRKRLLVPDIVYAEVANAYWKRVRNGQLSAGDALDTLRALEKAPLDRHPAQPLLADALRIACATDRTVYDSIYVALAYQENATLITADTKLYNALASGPHAGRVQLLAPAPPDPAA